MIKVDISRIPLITIKTFFFGDIFFSLQNKMSVQFSHILAVGIYDIIVEPYFTSG